MVELENIPGTGQEGRVSKKDILAYVANKSTGSSQNFTNQPQAQNQQPQTAVIAIPEQRSTNNQQQVTNNVQPAYQPPTVYTGNVEVIEMTACAS